MKARTEQLLASKGLHTRELKRGYGGIRDIEFAVQLLQLVHGRHDTSIRARARSTRSNSWRRVDTSRFPTPGSSTRRTYGCARSSTDCSSSRSTRPTRCRPTTPRVHTSHACSATATSPARPRSTSSTRSTSGTSASCAPSTRSCSSRRCSTRSPAWARCRWKRRRNASPHSASATWRRPAPRSRSSPPGSRAGRASCNSCCPRCSDGSRPPPTPTSGCSRSGGSPRATAAAPRWRADSATRPLAAERTCRILGSSRVLGAALYRQPEFVDALADDAILDAEATREELIDEALDSLDWRENDSDRRSGLRRFKRRHLLRIGARDVLGFAPVDTAGRELSRLADACVEAALRSLEPTLPFAVIGLGRLGGAELSYASDIDVIFVYDGATASDFDVAERMATRLVGAIGDSTSEGRTFRVDTRLRPEGNQGSLARSLAGYRAYFEQWAQTWEFQALTKARVVAGDAGVGRTLRGARAAVRVPRPVPRGLAARGSPDEGAHRERAHPAGRGPAVPPQARAGLALRHRVHGSARAAGARRRPPRSTRTVDVARPRRARRNRRDQRRGCGSVARVVRPVRARAQLPLSAHRVAGRLVAGRRLRSREACAHARIHPSASAVVARRLSARDASRAGIVERLLYGRED